MIPLIGGIGWQEILLIAAAIFILFGASRIPTAFRSLGEGLRSFKDGLRGDEAKDADEDKPAEKASSPAPSSESSGSPGK